MTMNDNEGIKEKHPVKKESNLHQIYRIGLFAKLKKSFGKSYMDGFEEAGIEDIVFDFCVESYQIGKKEGMKHQYQSEM